MEDKIWGLTATLEKPISHLSELWKRQLDVYRSGVSENQSWEPALGTQQVVSIISNTEPQLYYYLLAANC